MAIEHRLLLRQLKRYMGISNGELPPELANFMAAVDAAYKEADVDRLLAERSLDLSSEELLQRNSQFQALFEALPDTVFHLDAAGTVLKSWPGHTHNAFPVSVQGSTRPLRELLDPTAVFYFERAIRRAREQESLVTLDFTVGGMREDLSEHYEARIRSLLEGELIVLIRNITEQFRARIGLERAAEAAAQASLAKSRFLANMSHELRTPLNTVLAFSQLLQEDADELGATEMVPNLMKISGAGKHLLMLIDDLLDLAKIEAGRMEHHPASFDLAEMITGLQATVAPLMAVRDTVQATCPLAMASDDALSVVLSKERTEALAQKLKIPVPGSLRVESLEVGISAARTLPFPIVVKPERSIVWGTDGVGRALSVRYALDAEI